MVPVAVVCVPAFPAQEGAVPAVAAEGTPGLDKGVTPGSAVPSFNIKHKPQHLQEGWQLLSMRLLHL